MPVNFRPPSGLRVAEEAIAREFKVAVRDVTLRAHREAQRRYSGPTGRESLSPRSGYLRAKGLKIGAPTSPSPGVIIGRTYVDPRDPIYAGVHETGKTIRPKTAKFLTIPIRGGPAYPRGRARARAMRAREFAGAFFLKSKKGNLLLVRRRTKGRGRSKLELIFVLKKSVSIPARPVWAAVNRTMDPIAGRIFRQALERAIAAASGG